MADSINITAKLTLYHTENGGRKSPIHSGYRPNHVFEYKENSTEFVATYIGEINFELDSIHPGETATVNVTFLALHNIKNFLNEGRVWWLHEGERVIGKAQVLTIN
jgi:translation elongation factor EF-Tu-like GTPase